MKTVSIVQRRLPHYRVGFFEMLRAKLRSADIELKLFHGQGTRAERLKKDGAQIGWAEKVKNVYLPGTQICWQASKTAARHSDLLILPQENSLISNQMRILRRRSQRVAFWGHGANLQGDSGSIKEQFKRWNLRYVDWFFAYTTLSVELLENSGFPSERITCVNNSFDTRSLEALLNTESKKPRTDLLADFQLEDGPIALFIGSLYAHKKIPFLIEASKLVRSKIPKFQLLVAGSGPDELLIRQSAKDAEFIKFVGPVRDAKKARALLLADVIMNPGLLGLTAIDSFASETPILTTRCGLHSPEIAYIRNGINGVITDMSVSDYATAVTAVLSDIELRNILKQNCAKSLHKYSITSMIERYSDGIVDALNHPRRDYNNEHGG